LDRSIVLRNLTFAVVLVAAEGWAQPLTEFLKSSERLAFDARTSAVEVDRASAVHGQAWGALVPSLTASGGWTHNQYEAAPELPQLDGTLQKVVIVPKNQLEATLRAEVPLIDASKWVQVAASSATVESAGKRQLATRTQVYRQVVSAFYAHVAARQVLESAKRSLTVADAEVEVRRSRTAAGVGNELELMRGVAEVERNQQLLAAAEALVATTGRTLESSRAERKSVGEGAQRFPHSFAAMASKAETRAAAAGMPAPMRWKVLSSVMQAGQPLAPGRLSRGR